MASDGQMMPLGEVAHIVMGLSPKGDTYNHDGRGEPLLNGPTEFGPTYPIPVLFTTSPSRFAEPGDILFCVRGSTTGRMNWADRRYAIGRGIAAIRAKTNNSDTYFIYCSILADLPRLLSLTSGSVFPSLSTGDFAAFEIPWPDSNTRDGAVRVLRSLDDKIELNRRMNRTLEEMARAIFKSWFVDFDPVRAKAAVRREHPKWTDAQVSRAACPNLNPEIAALFPDSFEDSEVGEIPKGWRVGKLGEVAEHLRRGIRPDRLKRDTPYVALEHMPKRCIALSEWDVAAGLESNKFEFRKGEILFGKLRPYFHKVGVAPVDGVCSTDIVVVAPKSEVWFGFVLGHISSIQFVEYTNAGSTGTKMPRTSWAEMARYKVTLPPQFAAHAFTQKLQPSVDRIIAGIHESRTLASLRDALLPKLISGELRVPDAERIIGRAV